MPTPSSNADRLNRPVHPAWSGPDRRPDGLGIDPLDYANQRGGLVQPLIRHNPAG
ncbi:1-phosphatidylinositol phosphodiesterase OS=Streptomyces cyaneofuscatus OX=66883 GN=G3I52_22215 PE=4 SV=1 [Streptomyces cyaneofuscatus]